MPDYIRKLRSKIGKVKIIHPGARIIVENQNQEVLVIDRLDDGNLGLPAGGLEEGETIEECIRREVWEETGITINSLHVIGISTDPAVEEVMYPNGDCVQYFTIEFYSKDWEGTPTTIHSNEVKNARFVPYSHLEALAKNEQNILSSLSYFNANGKVLLH